MFGVLALTVRFIGVRLFSLPSQSEATEVRMSVLPPPDVPVVPSEGSALPAQVELCLSTFIPIDQKPLLL